MVLEQIILLLIFVGTLVVLVWNKLRYDLVALLALVMVALTGIVSSNEIFVGFGHPAVIMVASMFLIGKGLSNSGLVSLIVNRFSSLSDRPRLQLGILTTLSSLFSGFINNTGTTAVFMPAAIKFSRKAKMKASRFLIPLSYSAILGGIITLLGTPSNIIVATISERAGYGTFGLFEYAPLGLILTLVGLVFIWIFAWSFLPDREGIYQKEEGYSIKDYVTEVRVRDGSPLIGNSLKNSEILEKSDVYVVAISTDKYELLTPSGHEELKKGDVLLVQGSSEELEEFMDKARLELVAEKDVSKDKQFGDLKVLEVTVPPSSFALGKSARDLNLRWIYGVNLLAVSRQGQRVNQRLSDIKIEPGDILLFQGLESSLYEAFKRLGLVPIKEREIEIGQPRKIFLAVSIILAMILASFLGVFNLSIVFLAAALAMIFSGLISVDDIYKNIDWPVIVLMGAMISITEAMQNVGVFHLLSESLLSATFTFNAFALLAAVLVFSMLLSNIIDNAVVAVIMAPIAIDLAQTYSVSVDPFLMAVVVGSVYAFILPIGEQPNILVMGPGGYTFKDYAKIGSVLSVLMVAVSLPLILTFWPF